MTELLPFTFPATGQDVRTVVIDGEPWFVANDVCAVLGIVNVGNALARLDDDEKGSIRLTDGTPGNPNRALVNEPGLYALVLRSDKPDARVFKRWVTHEVLPAIRRTGSYGLDRPQLPQSYADALRELAASVEAKEQMRAELELAAPKADAWDVLASAAGDYSVRQAAQLLDRDPAISMGQNRLFTFMREIEWLDRKGQPFQRHVDAHRVRTRIQSYDHPRTGEPTLARPQIRVTVKGLRELHQRLGGVRPLVLPLGGAA